MAFPLHDLKDHNSASTYEDILKDYVENTETDILTQQVPHKDKAAPLYVVENQTTPALYSVNFFY